MAITIVSVQRENGAGCNHLIIVANIDGTQITERVQEDEALAQITGDLPKARRLLAILLVARRSLRGETLAGVHVPNIGDVATFGGGAQTSKPSGGGREDP